MDVAAARRHRRFELFEQGVERTDGMIADGAAGPTHVLEIAKTRHGHRAADREMRLETGERGLEVWVCHGRPRGGLDDGGIQRHRDGSPSADSSPIPARISAT